MKRATAAALALILLLALAACGSKTEAPAQETPAEWTREGYFTDENGNFLSVTRMEDVVDPGWYVGCMLGEDIMEDAWGGMLPQEGNALHGTLPHPAARTL